MDLKFSFGASNPLPLAPEGADSSPPPAPGSSRLELRLTLDGSTAQGTVACEGLSGDGVSYARAEKSFEDRAALPAAVRSALARAVAELPEPLIDSVTEVTLALGGEDLAVLSELGVDVQATSGLASVDEALQARTGIAAGTPIRVLDV